MRAVSTSAGGRDEASGAISWSSRLRRLRVWDAADVREFRLLWASEGVSVLGDQFHAVALSWLVITLTGSGLALGTVLIAVSVPRALLLMPMGVVADRRSPRSLMIASHIARAGIVGVIAVLAATGHASIPALAALGILFGCADAIFLPSMEAIVPRLVAADRLPSANAMLQSTLQLMSIVGPPIAGLVVAAAGTGLAFGVDAASFVIAAGLITLIEAGSLLGAKRASEATPGTAATSTESAPPPSPEPFLASLRGGLRYLLADRGIGMMLLISLVLNFAINGPASVGTAWLAQLRYHAGPTGLGILVAGWAFGGLAGTLVAGSARLERQGRLVVTQIVLSGVALAAVGVAGSIVLAATAFAVSGFCIGYINIVAVSWLQARVPLAMLGRVMSLVMLVGFGISPLSMATAGVLIDANAVLLFVGAGALIVAAGIAASALGVVELFNEPLRPDGATGSAGLKG